MAATHVPGDPDSVLRLYRIDGADRAPRRIPLAPIHSPLLYGMSLSPDGSHVALVVDREQNGCEQVLLVPVSGGAPATVLMTTRGDTHVFDVSLGPDGVLLAVVDLLSQRRELLLHDTGSRIAADGERGIFQIVAAAVSPSGTSVAVASTRHDGARFVVSLMPMNGEDERVLYERPAARTDPAQADLAFDAAGERLLVGYGDVVLLDVAGAGHSLLMRAEPAHWNRVAW
ncbi:unnamed protein product [[Actinomadura] parvosata subsp. kistnae]|nr:unnamed protein product [Actinomadura parvosata subsp. kistnae]